jgi:hypothetical protein
MNGSLLNVKNGCLLGLRVNTHALYQIEYRTQVIAFWLSFLDAINHAVLALVLQFNTIVEVRLSDLVAES